MLVNLFFSKRIISILYNFNKCYVASAKYVKKRFEVVYFHQSITYRLMGRNLHWNVTTVQWFCNGHDKCSKFLRIILQTRTESLKSCNVSVVWWSVKLVLKTETQKSLFCVRLWSLFTIWKLFRTGTDRCNGVLMSLLLSVAETMKQWCSLDKISDILIM